MSPWQPETGGGGGGVDGLELTHTAALLGSKLWDLRQGPQVTPMLTPGQWMLLSHHIQDLKAICHTR